MTVGLSTTANFGGLCGCFFGNVRYKTSNITWRYDTPCLPVRLLQRVLCFLAQVFFSGTRFLQRTEYNAQLYLPIAVAKLKEIHFYEKNRLLIH